MASIKEGEDRELFRDMMNRINEPVITSEIVTDMEAGMAFANKIGYPVIVRPAYTLGGTGGGFAHDEEELKLITKNGLKLSISSSEFGWEVFVIAPFAIAE